MYSSIKRLFDLFLSLFLVFLFSPLYGLLVILLLVFNKGEIFYIQNRIGFKNEEFGIIKFATMLKDSEKLPGGSITVRNDPRVTPIGRILRISKLNELPQLFNVILGDMSFVGPRPLVKVGFDFYSYEVQSSIYNSKPGITGISSVIFRDEEKWVSNSNMEPVEFYKKYVFPYKEQLEMWYLKNKSFSTDLIILFLTGIKILAPENKLEFKIFPTLPSSEYFSKAAV
jgi:lipopolysaccharide/colanic/teichoic acid biosynthesis glycosyltransferase